MTPDIVIIGSGMGGATLAAALAPSGKRIVILERGEVLQDCPEARDPWAVFGSGFFSPVNAGAMPMAGISPRTTTITPAAIQSSMVRC